MKIIFNLIFTFCFVSCIAQNYINQSYDYANTNTHNAFDCLKIYHDTVFCIGGNQNDSNLLDVNVYLLNLASGNLLDLKTYKSPKYTYYNGGLGSNISEICNSIYIFGTRQKLSNDSADALLYKYNKAGDSLNTKLYVDTTVIAISFFYSLLKGVSLYSAGYLISYDSLYSHKTNQIFMMKVDTNGNILSQHIYGYPHNIESISGFKQSKDGGFFLIGTVRDYGQWQQNYLVKTDSLGNMLWQRKWGATYDDELYDVHELSNGNLMLTGYTSTDINLPRACVTIMNSNATQQLSQRFYLGSTYAYVTLTKIFSNSNGTYDVWGNEQNGTIIRPFMIKLDANFDSIDFHYYSYWNEGFQPVNILRDIVRLPDSGYVACGFGWDQYSSQDAWLLRIDKDGCANVNCTPLNLQAIASENNLSVFPSPANFELNIESQEVFASIVIFNFLGKELYSNQANQKKINVDVSQWSDGIYFINVKTLDDRLVTKKIVISH
jgi:hypothetical protein